MLLIHPAGSLTFGRHVSGCRISSAESQPRVPDSVLSLFAPPVSAMMISQTLTTGVQIRLLQLRMEHE